MLCGIMNDDHREINAESLGRLGRLLGCTPPSRRAFLKQMEQVDAEICNDSLVEYEFLVMEAIRDAFSLRTRRYPVKRPSESVISETTNVGSVFSRVSDSKAHEVGVKAPR